MFGPTPRSYAQYVPRQVRALARKSALNARARENAIFVIDAFNYDAPKTSRARRRSSARSASRDKKVLILTDGVKPNVFLSGRNLPNVHVMPYSDVSTYHILWSDVVLIEAGALGADARADARSGGRRSASARRRRGEGERSARRRRPAAKKAAAKKAAGEEGRRQEGRRRRRRRQEVGREEVAPKKKEK